MLEKVRLAVDENLARTLDAAGAVVCELDARRAARVRFDPAGRRCHTNVVFQRGVSCAKGNRALRRGSRSHSPPHIMTPI